MYCAFLNAVQEKTKLVLWKCFCVQKCYSNHKVDTDHVGECGRHPFTSDNGGSDVS